MPARTINKGYNYSIGNQTIGYGRYSYEEIFTMMINNVNEAPTDVSLGKSIDDLAEINGWNI